MASAPVSRGSLKLDNSEMATEIRYLTSQKSMYDAVKAGADDIYVMNADDGYQPLMVLFKKGRKNDSASSYTSSSPSVRSEPGQPGRYREARRLKKELLTGLFPGKVKEKTMGSYVLKRRNTTPGEIKVIGMTKYISVGFYYSNSQNFGRKNKAQHLYKFKDQNFAEYPGMGTVASNAVAAIDRIKNMSVQAAATVTFGKSGYKRGIMLVLENSNSNVISEIESHFGIKCTSSNPLKPYGTLLPYRKRKPLFNLGPPRRGFPGPRRPSRGRGFRGRGRGAPYPRNYPGQPIYHK